MSIIKMRYVIACAIVITHKWLIYYLSLHVKALQSFDALMNV